jgi:hypothetical protein
MWIYRVIRAWRAKRLKAKLERSYEFLSEAGIW